MFRVTTRLRFIEYERAHLQVVGRERQLERFMRHADLSDHRDERTARKLREDLAKAQRDLFLILAS